MATKHPAPRRQSTLVKDSPYDDDTIGNLFAKNALLLRMVIDCRIMLDHFSECKMTPNDAMAVARLKTAIDEYQKRAR